MKKEATPKKSSHDGILLDGLLKTMWILLTGPFVLIVLWLKNNPSFLIKLDLKKRILIFSSLLVLSLCIILIFKFREAKLSIKEMGLIYVCVLIAFLSLGVLLLPLLNWKKVERITTKNLDHRAKDFSELLPILFDPEKIPLGISLQSSEPFFLPVHQSLEHVVISGATGVGKTSALLTMLQHNLKHHFPVIIIDPKGDLVDLTIIKDMAKTYGRESDLMIFSLSDPSNSCSYNITKVGTPENKKSKLIDGLSLTHEYYGSIAELALSNIFEILEFFKEDDVDMERVLMLLSNEEQRGLLEERIINLPEGPQATRVLMRFDSLRKIAQKDLTGLCAQLQNFSMGEFGGIMLKAQDRREIDLMDVLMSNKIVYFQLNTNAYSSLARKFGKLIIQDLRFTSSRIQSSIDGKRAKFAAVFIDEFGSFAMKDFADFQKMVRTAGISLRLFFQGMADLNTVSKEFGDQVLGNCLTKIVFRQDIDDDVAKWAAMAGTVDAMIESFQTEERFFSHSRTGTGNVHEGKKMKIEFDVFKELGKGQAVVIDKGRKINDLIEIWDAKNPSFLPNVKNYLEKISAAESAQAKREAQSVEIPSTEISDYGSSYVFKKTRPQDFVFPPSTFID